MFYNVFDNIVVYKQICTYHGRVLKIILLIEGVIKKVWDTVLGTTGFMLEHLRKEGDVTCQPSCRVCIS